MMHKERIVVAAGGAQSIFVYEYSHEKMTWIMIGHMRRDWFTDDPDVDIDEDIVAVTTEDIGLSFVYIKSGNEWKEQALLRSVGEPASENRGMSIRVKGSLVFTARNGNQDNDPGAVYVHDLKQLQ